MTRKKKIRLESIKVKSFVTSLDPDEKKKINGGIPQLTDPVETCVTNTAGPTCPAISYPQTECECFTMLCPSYICEESVTCN